MTGENLIQQFLRVSEVRPEQYALLETGSGTDRGIRYGELDKAVRQFAGWLNRSGLEPGERVGIHLPNSVEYVIAYYGAWSAGMVPVALNTQATSHELAGWIEHSGCSLLVGDEIKANSAKAVPAVRMSWDAEQGLSIDQQPLDCEEYQLQLPEDAVATLIYTSGTTGAPKGITLGHDNLASNIAGVRESLSIQPGDRFLCVLPFYYSFGNSILHSHLSAGATLVMLDPAGYPSRILDALEQHACHGFAGVPSLYLSLLKKTDFSKYDLGNLRYLTQAGGPLAVEFIQDLLHRLPSVKLHVMYGQTECSARIACLPPEKLQQKMGSVGLPIAGLELEVVDADGQSCAPGVAGEIRVRGSSVMKGYWRDPERTREVIRDGWLHTGDRGYLDEEGYLYIVGRQSEMLKIAENRVSPYEIEEVLLEIPGVDECAVVGCEHPLLGQAAHAAIVRSDPGLNELNIKKHCKQRLAFYKIPKTIRFVDALPKTSSGKIKRSEIPCPST